MKVSDLGSGQSTSVIRQVVTGLFIVVLLATAAGMRFWPVTPVAASELASPFEWSMRPRHTGNSLINPNDLTAAREYVSPSAGYAMVFDGCAAFTDDMTAVTHSYTITGGSLDEPKVVSASAEPRRIPPKLGGGFEPIDCNDLRVVTHLPLGSYSVSLHIEMADGYTADSAPQTVVVKDILILSVGDSYGSGEGAPDRMVEYGLFGFPSAPAFWQDQRCHRSAWAGASQGAAILESADPHTSVTFVSLACSGATINTAIDDNPDDGTLNTDRYQGAGLLTGYSGIEHDGSYDPATFLPPQMEQAARIANGRAVDALLISGGGNDMHFANVIIDCVLSECNTNKVTSDRLEADFQELPVRYDELNAFITNERDTSEIPALNVTSDRVFITEYPNPTRNTDGSWCWTNQLDDPLLSFPGTGINPTEMAWASEHVVTELNSAIKVNAQQHGWNYVSGIADEFFGDPARGLPGHGWCALGEDANGAPNNWINRSLQALAMQGPVTLPLGLILTIGAAGISFSIISGGVSLLLTVVSAALLLNELKSTAGTMHPNRMGQMVYARHIANAVQNRLNGVLPSPDDTEPPVIAPAQNITVQTLDAAGAVVTYPIPATTDNVDGAGLASCAPASGSLFPIGTTPVTCSAQDASGNQATAVRFLVTVEPITGTIPDPSVFETSLHSGCTYADSDNQSISNDTGPVTFDGANVFGLAGGDALKARASATDDDCGMRVTANTDVTVGAGETGLVEGDPVLLSVTVGLDGKLTTSADHNQVAIATMDANYTIVETNCPNPGPWPELFDDEGGYCPAVATFSAGIDMDMYGGSTDQWYARGSWSAFSNVAEEQSDFSDTYCDDHCADPVNLPFDTGLRTIVFESHVGANLSISAMLDTFATGYLGATAISDFANTFAVGVVRPAPGFEGLSIEYGQGASNLPPTVEIDGVMSVEEGGTVQLFAIGVDPEGGELAYAWDFDGDGEFEVDGQDATFSAAEIDGPATRVVAVRVSDDAGATAEASREIEILNATPIVAIEAVIPIDEGGVFGADGSFSDTGSRDAHTATIDFGDGTGSHALTLNTDGTFGVERQYLDNGTYLVTVTVTDDDGVAGTATTTAVVHNVGPAVELGTDVTLRRGETLVTGGAFTDPGADTWTASVDYADGSGAQPLVLNTDGTFDLHHTYTVSGEYTVQVCVTDDDNGTGCDSLVVTVTPYAIFVGSDDCAGNVLQVAGSKNTFFGDIHSNSGVNLTGSKHAVNGDLTYRCAAQISGSKHEFTSGPTQVSDSRPWPAQMEATAFVCDITFAGTFDLSNDGVWWVGGTQASGQLASVTICADSITLEVSNVSGTVTLVAESIHLSGSNMQLSAHQHGVLAFATGGDRQSVKLSGRTNQFSGDLVARSGGLDLSGSGNRLLGAAIGWTVSLSGSSWTIDARVPMP